MGRYTKLNMKKNILLIGGSTGIGLDVLKDDISSLDLPEQLDGLVYCPGSINLKPFKMLKPKEFNQASLEFFSSVAVKVGMPFHTSVAAAKGAIEGFAKSLAAEYAPSLRVNVVSPSLT